MAVFKTVFIGKVNSGKSQLIRQLSSPNNAFQEESAETKGVDFLARKTPNEQEIYFWDLAGDVCYETISYAYLRGADVCILCIDLTEEFDEPYFSEKIMLFQEYSSGSPIILVGTKADIPTINADTFEKINALGLFSKCFITSAKNKTGVEELFSYLSDLCYKKHREEVDLGEKVMKRGAAPDEEALEKLYTSLGELPVDKKSLIKKELEILSNKLPTNPEAIAEFTNNCEDILEGKYAKVLNAVLTLAAIALVTVVASLVGFCIGFACGWWTGPGAFFTGLAAGYVAATAVTATSITLGITTGGLTALGLFKTSKEMTAVNKFTAEIALAEIAIY